MVGRPRVQLKLIEDQKIRRSSFRQRKKGLKKKAYELSTLCGVPAMMICYGPTGAPETWPEDPRALHDVIALYADRANAPGEHRLDLQSYFTEQIRKKKSLLDQITRDCEELARSLDSRIDSVRNRIEQLVGDQGRGAVSSLFGCEGENISNLPLFPLDNSLGLFADYTVDFKEDYYGNIGSESNGWLHLVETMINGDGFMISY